MNDREVVKLVLYDDGVEFKVEMHIFDKHKDKKEVYAACERFADRIGFEDFWIEE